MVILNKAGAGGAIGTAAALQAPADGYTVLYSLSSVATLPEQAKVDAQKPAFRLDQLVPVARITARIPQRSSFRQTAPLRAS